MNDKCGKHGHIGIEFCECKLFSLRKENEALRVVLKEVKVLLINLMFACVQADFATEIMEKHKGIGVKISKALAASQEHRGEGRAG